MAAWGVGRHCGTPQGLSSKCTAFRIRFRILKLAHRSAKRNRRRRLVWALAPFVVLGRVHQAQVAHVRDPFGVRSQARVVVIVIRRALEAIAVLEESAAHRAGRPGRRRADRGSTGVRRKTEARTVRRGKRRSEEPRCNDVSSRRSRFDGGGSLCKETVKR